MDITNIICENLLDNLHDGLYIVDTDRTITYWNRAAEKISGFKSAEVVGKSCHDNILTHVDGDGNSLCFGMCPLAASIEDQVMREAEVYMHHKDGHRIPISVRTSVLTDKDNKVIGGIELFSDISNQAVSILRIKELEKMALLDNLTQLANRHYIEKEMKSRFEERKRFNMPFGILFMDIDHFKKFNDTYGHDVGDQVLKFVSATLVKNARPFDLFGRWGGEEFVGIIRNISQEGLAEIGDRMRMLIEKSYVTYGNEKLNVTISVGATRVRDDDTPESILKRADQFLYKSKIMGRNRLTLDSEESVEA